MVPMAPKEPTVPTMVPMDGTDWATDCTGAGGTMPVPSPKADRAGTDWPATDTITHTGGVAV